MDKNGETHPRRCCHKSARWQNFVLSPVVQRMTLPTEAAARETSHVVHGRMPGKARGGVSDPTARSPAKPFRGTALLCAVARTSGQQRNLVDLRVPPVPIGVLLERSRGLNGGDVVARAGDERKSNR